MVEYEGCFINKDGEIYTWKKIKNYTDIKFIDKILTYCFVSDISPKIIMTKKEAENRGMDYKNNPKGFYIKSKDGIRIIIKII